MFRSRLNAGEAAGRAWLQLGLCAAAATACAQPIAAPPPSPAVPVVASEAVTAAFRRADSNGDGLLTRDESAHLPAIYAQFDELDVDRDGLLSFAEFNAGLAKVQ